MGVVACDKTERTVLCPSSWLARDSKSTVNAHSQSLESFACRVHVPKVSHRLTLPVEPRLRASGTRPEVHRNTNRPRNPSLRELGTRCTRACQASCRNLPCSELRRRLANIGGLWRGRRAHTPAPRTPDQELVQEQFLPTSARHIGSHSLCPEHRRILPSIGASASLGHGFLQRCRADRQARTLEVKTGPDHNRTKTASTCGNFLQVLRVVRGSS